MAEKWRDECTGEEEAVCGAVKHATKGALLCVTSPVFYWTPSIREIRSSNSRTLSCVFYNSMYEIKYRDGATDSSRG